MAGFPQVRIATRERARERLRHSRFAVRSVTIRSHSYAGRVAQMAAATDLLEPGPLGLACRHRRYRIQVALPANNVFATLPRLAIHRDYATQSDRGKTGSFRKEAAVPGFQR